MGVFSVLMVLSVFAVANTLPAAAIPQPKCEGSPMDIYFLLDCSSSVWIVDYDKQKEFVVSIIQSMHIASSATRVGLGVFSDMFYEVVPLGRYLNTEELVKRVRDTLYLSGNTYTDRGLRGMRTYGFGEGGRDNVTRVGVLITDGRSRHRSNTVAEAQLAREAGVWLFAVGVGSDVDPEELSAIASQPAALFSLHVPSFDRLADVKDKVVNTACSLHPPQADGAVCGSNKKADVMFVYNAAAMANRNVRQVQEFMQVVIGQFSMTSGNVRAGVISQGCHSSDIDLGQYLRPEDLTMAISNQPQAGFSPLLKKLRLYGYLPAKGGRRDAVKMAVVFVDDVVLSPEHARYEAVQLGYDHVIIHVIALGEGEGQAKDLATSPNHITKFASYEELSKPLKQKEFIDTFCESL